MPIKKGNTTIGAIYKGTTQIAKVYKGTKLLFENAVWLDYYFNNLYHDLVPETISSKSVKNKAKVSVIEGNGVVENNFAIPLNNGGWTAGSPYVSATSTTDSKFSGYVSSLPSDIGILGLFNYRFDPSNGYVSAVSGHKYLLSFNITFSRALNNLHFEGYGNNSQISLGSVLANTKTLKSYIYTANSSSTYLKIIFDWYGTSNIQANDTFTIENLNLIDLTQMFGTGNEPTTLTDNRIQALLNRGYIPYNTGAYKGTDIGLFSSESYNLFDGILTDGYLENNGNITAEANGPKTSTNYIKVMPNTTYTWEVDKTTNERYICEYDEHKTAIKLTYVSSPYQITTQANTRYVRVEFKTSPYTTDVNACFHHTGTRTGYAPHQSFTPIAFKYQGNGAINAHDTMTVTKDNVVFGKNMGRKTFGSSESLIDFSADSGNCRFGYNLYGQQSNSGTTTPNILSDGAVVITPAEWYARSKTGFTFGSSGYGGNGRLYAAILGVSSVADAQNWLNGKTIEYELQASDKQTITIPRKHLGVVDMGTLEWDYVGGSYTAYAQLPGAKNVIWSTVANIYCEKYLTFKEDDITSQSKGLSFANVLIVKDSSLGTSSAQVKSSLSGVYLFYETQNEVADILDTLDIEPGGTVNANLFSWVENQIVYDGNFANGTNDWFCQGTIYSQSASNNIMTVTKNASGAGSVCSKSNSDITYDGTHKLLALAQIKPSRNCTMNFVVSDVQTGQSMTANVWNTLSYFVNPGSPHSLYFGIYETNNTLQVNDTVDIKNVMLIDLTQAYGAGNEPTNVNDPRIQYILNKGYIPTNTTGTYKLVDCEVLPNVEFNIKCK